MPYSSIEQIKAKNINAGQHFFSPDTMRFFKTRVSPTIYGGRYFITSEVNPSGVRRYSVRRAEDNGVIVTVGDFHGMTYYEAVKLARECARKDG